MPHRKLLVADDSLTIQKVIRLALSSSVASGGDSYEIQAVSDGESALQQISLFRPDIVLVDVNLPGKTAVELKSQIDSYGNEFQNLRFVLLSSAFEKLDETSIEAAGFQYRLSKPFDPAHLRQVLATVGATLGTTATTPHPTGRVAPTELPPPAPNSSVNASPEPLAIEISLEPPHIKAEVQVEKALPPMADLPRLSVGEPEPEEDIKQLTRETFAQVPQFEMQPEPPRPNLDSLSVGPPPSSMPTIESDSEWSVQEPATLAPYPASSTLGTINYSIPPKVTAEPIEEPTLPPLSSDILMDFGDSDFPLIREIRQTLAPPSLTDRPDLGEIPGSDIGIREVQPQFQPLPPPPIQSDIGVAPLSVEQMEAILSRQLESSIQELARKLLPDLAERIIKEEIHRMLQQQP
jgi:CheY-like chemotaxis protein